MKNSLFAAGIILGVAVVCSSAASGAEAACAMPDQEVQQISTVPPPYPYAAYTRKKFTGDADRVAFLFERYAELINEQ